MNCPQEIRKLTFRALALRRSESRVVGCGLCLWFIYRKMELRFWLVHGNVDYLVILPTDVSLETHPLYA